MPRGRAKESESALKALLAESEKKSADLQAQVAQLEERVGGLAQQNSASDSRTRELQKQLQTAEEVSRRQTERMTERLLSMQERIKRAARLEAAILDLHMEMLDRSDEEASRRTAAEVARQREEISARAKHDPLVILEYLRANLRMQLAFKDDFEHELQQTLDSRRSQHQQELSEARERLEHHRRERERADEVRAYAVSRMEEAERGKADVVRSSKVVVARAKEEVQRLRAQLRKQESSSEGLVGQVQEYEAMLQKQELLLMQMSKVEGEIEKQKAAHHHELLRVQADHKIALESANARLQQASKVEQERDALKQEVARLRKDVAGFQRNLKAVRVGRAEAAAKRATQNARSAEAERDALRKELRRVKVVADERQKKIKAMKVEYNRLFSAVQETRKKEQFGRPSDAEAAELANQNPYVIEQYKKKLRLKETQVAELTRQVHRLLAGEHSYKSTQRALEHERAWSVKHVAQLRQQLEVRDLQLKGDRGSKHGGVFNVDDSAQLLRDAAMLPDEDYEDQADADEATRLRNAHNALAIAAARRGSAEPEPRAGSAGSAAGSAAASAAASPDASRAPSRRQSADRPETPDPLEAKARRRPSTPQPRDMQQRPSLSGSLLASGLRPASAGGKRLSRAESAGAVGRRPQSASRLRGIGSTRSTLRVGSLLRPAVS